MFYELGDKTQRKKNIVIFIYETAHCWITAAALHNADAALIARVLCFMSVSISQIVISDEQQASPSVYFTADEKQHEKMVIKPDNNLKA